MVPPIFHLGTGRVNTQPICPYHFQRGISSAKTSSELADTLTTADKVSI